MSDTEFPPSWSAVPLGEIAEVRLGRQRSPDRANGPNMRSYMRAGNVTWSGVDTNDIKQMDFTPEEFETFRLRKGDLLVVEGSGSATEVGKPAIWNDEVADCCFQNTLIRVRVPSPLVAWLHAHFRSDARSGKFAEASRGIGIHHIGAKALEAWNVALPPLSEQKRIVAKLDDLQARSEAAKEALDAIPPLLEKFRQSVLASAFRGDLTRKWREQNPTSAEWQSVDLQSICTSIADGDHQAPPQSDSGIPFITISAMNSGTIYLDRATRSVPQSYYDSLKTERKPRHGDVLYSVTGSIGIPAMVESDTPFVFQRHIAILRPNPARVRARFLCHRLGGDDIRQQAQNIATGTAQVTIPLGGLRRFTLTMPSLAEQDEIVRRIDLRLDALTKIASTLPRLFDERLRLNQSILAKAFRGELVAQDPNDEPAAVLLERIKAERACSGAAVKPKRGRKAQS